jgi:hypothetical protein
MSTIPYGPNNEYQIGTIDFEYTEGSFSKLIGDAIRSVYRSIRTPLNLLLGSIDGTGASVPTYGLWSGPGWSGNDRPINSEDIKWEQLPCYNKSIIRSEGNPLFSQVFLTWLSAIRINSRVQKTRLSLE